MGPSHKALEKLDPWSKLPKVADAVIRAGIGRPTMYLLRLLIITGIFPPDIGGPATYVPQIAGALTERGHQCTVVTLSDQLDHDDKAYPFRVIRLARGERKPLRWFRTIKTVIRLGRKADVLFVHGLALEAVIANRVLRKPLVHKVVGDLVWERSTQLGWVRDTFEDFQHQRYSLKIEFLKALRTWWLRQAGMVIVPSNYLARCVTNWGVADTKLKVIYNALHVIDGIQPAKLPLATPTNVVTVGRLVPWKHVDKIIEVISQFNDQVGLVIIGDGPERTYLEKVTHTLGITDRIYFAGQRCQAETLALMTACDLFVLNSTYEGLPHVVLEAMTVGLPVVATAVGGTPEVIEDWKNGCLISPTDKDALAGTVQKLIALPSERHRLSTNAKQTITRFTNLRMVQETETALQKVAKSG